jgi:hypothetical protein
MQMFWKGRPRRNRKKREKSVQLFRCFLDDELAVPLHDVSSLIHSHNIGPALTIDTG